MQDAARLRQVQKYTVRTGGVQNNRMALWDGILIKENHIVAAGGIAPALRAAFAKSAGVVEEWFFNRSFLLPHGTPNTVEQERNTAPDALESVFGCWQIVGGFRPFSSGAQAGAQTVLFTQCHPGQAWPTRECSIPTDPRTFGALS